MATHSSTRILIVDDNREAADLLGELLTMQGFTTSAAYDGYMALDAALSFDPHIIILDLGMPKFSGDEVALMLRQVSKLKRVYIIALTSWGDSKARELTRRAGFNMHLTKPVEMADLSTALEAASRSIFEG